jgi:hypothetical protein
VYLVPDSHAGNEYLPVKSQFTQNSQCYRSVINKALEFP